MQCCLHDQGKKIDHNVGRYVFLSMQKYRPYLQPTLRFPESALPDTDLCRLELLPKIAVPNTPQKGRRRLVRKVLAARLIMLLRALLLPLLFLAVVGGHIAMLLRPDLVNPEVIAHLAIAADSA